MAQIDSFFLLICLFVPVFSVLPEDDNSCFNQCFYQPKEACPPRNKDKLCTCQQLTNCKGAAICCDVNKFTLMEGISCGNLTKIKALHIRNATFSVLDMSDTKLFSRSLMLGLQYLSITDGNISNITGQFAKQTQIQCLNLSSNALNGVGIKDRTLANLFHLNYLDMSNNNLTEIPKFKKDGNITLNISNNKYLICNDSLKTLLQDKGDEVAFINQKETFCQIKDSYKGWMDTSYVTIPFNIYRKSVEVNKYCILNCSCSVHRLTNGIGLQPYFEIKVDCGGKNFSALPTPLPEHTVSLNISNNNLTSLKEFGHPSYDSLRYFWADSNEITSILPLEWNRNFITSFEYLSLQSNKIRTFETYLLDKIHFYRNADKRRMYVGGNRIMCDCNTIKLKSWLTSQSVNVPDSHDIICENLNMGVMELDSTKLCQSPQDWTDYIYYIIGGEIFLLVGLITKVSYDYWVFKTAGYLPWPASKMPRLPCDWLCE